MTDTIIFDYGGTLDNDGDHWGTTIYKLYRHLPAQPGISTYKQMYIHAERACAAQKIILPHYTFEETLRAKVRLQLRYWLGNDAVPAHIQPDAYISEIARLGHERAKEQTAISAAVLSRLSQRYKLCLVSNFYGNLRTVLRHYGLEQYFGVIIDSAEAGVRKPDPAIFALAIDRARTSAQNCLVVGDSIGKDIVPALSLGCKVLKINGEPWLDAAPEAVSVPTIEHIVQLESHINGF